MLVWAFPLSLATTQGIFSFPGVTKMFQFTPFPLLPYVFRQQYQSFTLWWVSPFGYPRILRLHTTPRGFSQCATSFFGV